MIDIKNVSKIYRNSEGGVEALKNINIHIDKGEIFGIIGLSGAGKSTLIRCINRLEEPTEGEILVNNQNILTLSDKEIRTARRKIGMIFQHFNLLSSRTVQDNISYPLEINSTPKTKIEKKVSELVNLVELTDKALAYPSQLSGGQKQRVGIARALANDPDVLLCDEATSALDPKTTKSILRLIKKINAQFNLTVVVITHQMEVIKEICSKVAVIEDGQIVEKGPVTEVFSKPQHKITKSFLHSVSRDLPESWIMAEDLNKKVYSLSFIGSRTQEPIISKMIKEFDVDANILLGGIDNLQNIIVGNLIVELSGNPIDISNAVTFLREKEVKCEEIG